MKKLLSFILVILSVVCCIAFAGCDYSLQKAKKSAYAEWTDQNGKMYFRTISAGRGQGYIILNGKKVDADFSFGIQSSLQVVVLVDDLHSDDYRPEDYESTYGVAEEWVTVKDVNKQGQLISTSSDVVLFGEHFGKLILTRREVDKSTVDAWDYCDTLKYGKNEFAISGLGCHGYAARKCKSVCVKREGKTQYYILKWFPEEKKFALCAHYDCGFVEDGEPTLAEGTYTNSFEEVTLNFSKDEVFGYTYQGITLKVSK